jgi:transcriptional regulator with PAS, ATPase and Fis domain
MPETLLEAVLFGVLKGAFTDAHRDRVGRIARAEGGTLFLDEIGDLPAPLQIKLLRFLQDHRYEPLGSSDPIEADVRVIAATNRDLERLVQDGSFRVDFYYRLNVFQIPLPPLRDRTEDIPLLVSQFIRRFRSETSRPIDGIADRALAALMTYPWPGNIRELENAIEHAFILCPEFEFEIDLEHLPPHVRGDAPGAGAVEAGPESVGAGRLETLEREALLGALDRSGGNRSAAARELGIHRTTLLRKLKRLDLVS